MLIEGRPEHLVNIGKILEQIHVKDKIPMAHVREFHMTFTQDKPNLHLAKHPFLVNELLQTTESLTHQPGLNRDRQILIHEGGELDACDCTPDALNAEKEELMKNTTIIGIYATDIYVNSNHQVNVRAGMVEPIPGKPNEHDFHFHDGVMVHDHETGMDTVSVAMIPGKHKTLVFSGSFLSQTHKFFDQWSKPNSNTIFGSFGSTAKSYEEEGEEDDTEKSVYYPRDSAMAMYLASKPGGDALQRPILLGRENKRKPYMEATKKVVDQAHTELLTMLVNHDQNFKHDIRNVLIDTMGTRPKQKYTVSARVGFIVAHTRYAAGVDRGVMTALSDDEMRQVLEAIAENIAETKS